MKAKNKKDIDFNSIDKILVRSTNWIGDVILTFPAIATIRKNFPKSYIATLSRPWVAPLLENNPEVDEVIIYDHKEIHNGMLGKLRLAKALREKGFDLAVLFQNAFDAALIAFLAGIPIRAGYNTDARGPLLTNKVILDKAVLKKHQSHYYLEMLKAVGMDIVDDHPAIEVSDEARKRATEILDSFNIQESELLIGINPGAYFGSAKRWLPERYALLSDMINKDFGGKILLFGSGEEKAISEMILSIAKSDVIDLVGKTSLLETMALIEKCSLFITNDSGLMHLAAALKIPLIAIFGSTDPVTTSPLGSSSVIVRKEVSCSPCLKKECPTDHQCMRLIEVGDVYQHVKQALTVRVMRSC
ncbi:MAG: lipopolysaccharide heptosyltransferase II [Desulfobacterales bacterium]|nr:lipopolysaccharide heptosyltransferase II [Desulfobacterales bacterium]